MAQVNVTINGRQFRMACGAGEEGGLPRLAEELDRRIRELRASFGEIGDTRLTVMAALAVADELSEIQEKLQRLEPELATWQQALPRCRPPRASLWHKAIRPVRCIGSCRSPPADRTTPWRASLDNISRSAWASNSSSRTKSAPAETSGWLRCSARRLTAIQSALPPPITPSMRRSMKSFHSISFATARRSP